MHGSYAQEWPGWGAPRTQQHHHHDEQRGGGRGGRRCGPGGPGGTAAAAAAANWLFARGGGRHGRPTPEELEEWIALRKMRGGPFGGPGGPFGHGPRGRGRGRGRRRRGDVRLAVLRLLAEEPLNGYQLMQTIEERSQGSWRPSPGSVYPTLSQLEDEGLIRSVDADGGRRFEITDAGTEHLGTRSEEPDPWEPEDGSGEEALHELGPLVIGIGKAAWQVASVGTQAQRTRAIALLAETRRALYGILAEEPVDEDNGEDGSAGAEV